MFYIAQMADFHFGGAPSKENSEEDILTRMTEKIRSEVPEGSTVVLCACGDYIDSRPVQNGDGKRPLREDEVKVYYEAARETIVSAVINPLGKTHRLLIGLCAGNHDITHEEEMLRFSRSLNGQEIDRSYCLPVDGENTDLIFINSCPKGEHGFGQIDYAPLEKLLSGLRPDSAKYFIMHHALINMDEEDKSSLRNVPRLMKLIEQYSVKAVLHGHTHGQYGLRLGENCPVIGVGTVYVRDYANVNSQFNLLCCGRGGVRYADNYRYHADLAMNPDSDGFQKTSIHVWKEGNFFYGTAFSEVYEELAEKVRAESKLYHVRLHVKSGFEAFCADVEAHFAGQTELQTLDASYSYGALAELWEAPERNEDLLYFNHGMYFSKGTYDSGTGFLAHELKEKQTSSRAVLATVNSQDISGTPPDALLPSLLSIQAGFDQTGTALHIAMNLRALEASRFLKINICEILYVAKKIYEEHPFERIEAELSAFRVQIIDQFGCFLKAKMDMEKRRDMMTGMLSSLVYSEEPACRKSCMETLIKLIQDKRQRSETVIETKGLENLLGSVTTVKGMLPKNKEAFRESLERILACLEELLAMLDQLKKRREKISEPTKDMNALEESIQARYDRLLREFQELAEA